VTDDEFRRLLADYLDTANPDMADIVLDLQPGNSDFGIDHAIREHGVTEVEVREVLFELPAPERKRSIHWRQPVRTLFWGPTRAGRDITVVVLESAKNNRHYMTLVTAFPESEGEWRRRK